MMKKIILLVYLLIQGLGGLFAENHWRTHFSYNSVQQIAMDTEEVYALANGKLFSINKQTEQLTLFNNFSGLHGTEIVQIAYDDNHEQLLILYSDGKMDILHDKKMRYVSDLYNKQMTSSRICNNITIQEEIAYLAMDFGILTFDLEACEFVDAYYIAPEAKEVKVLDVMFHGDSIYALTRQIVYSAHIEDNIVDFRCWKECTELPQPFDDKKGKEYVDERGGLWKVAGDKGVLRNFETGEQAYYLPDGPCVNNPYRIEYANGRLFMVPGGRWAAQENKPGNIMIYEDDKWTNITNTYIEQQTKKKALDFMDVAVDPQNPSHFFVSSYGTGLYEFRDDEFYARYTSQNSILGSAAPTNPDRYTRLESVVFDTENRMWTCLDGGIDTTLVCFLPDGTQRGLNLYTDSTTRFVVPTSSSMVIDVVHPQKKWLVSCRSNPAVLQLDDGGTSFDPEDDKCVAHNVFYDQDGKVVVPDFFYTLAQAPNGDIWVGSSSGPIIIPTTIDFLQSNHCRRLCIKMSDGSNFLDLERVNAFAWDDKENVWIGTQTGGVYVLNPDATEILEHYTSDNSVMPSNSVLSLAYDSMKRQMFIGTGMGLVSYILEPDVDVGLDVFDENLSDGNMYRWRSHAAVTKIEEVVVMGEKTYGLSSHSLFSVDKRDGEIEYYNKLDGLSGSIINHIAYNESLDRMLITYQNGQIDVMASDGTVFAISDLFLKQMSASKKVNDICMYHDKAILAMSFGILEVDMKKAEIADTYYIGNEGAEVNVNQIAINRDTIYAATNGILYYANMQDNLVDYAYWKIKSLPTGTTLHSLRSFNDKLYCIVDMKPYVLMSNSWKPITSPYSLRRLRPSANHLYVLPYYVKGICKISPDHKVTLPITYGYNCDVLEQNGSYWLGTKENGIVHYRETEDGAMIQEYLPDGPSSNSSYRLKFFGDKLYMLPGGRWAAEYRRLGEIMIYEDGLWQNIKNEILVKQVNNRPLYDFMNVAQDPNDEKHYFITSYGNGLLEMRDSIIVKSYLPENSNLFSAIDNLPNNYTRTDGAMYDDQGNLWVLNAGGGTEHVHVISPNGLWKSFGLEYNGSRVVLETPGEILVDSRNPQWKWIPLLRSNTGLLLLQDNGTPTDNTDDRVTYRKQWVDQNSKLITPREIYAIAQDKDQTLWVGTSSGIFAIPSYVDFTLSNQCIRVVIPRNDGTKLGDYLLDNEQINAIVVDGANRLWVGTASSGVYLLAPIGDISDPNYTIETIAHFTTENSIMPSNDVLSIAIQESTGEVFIGTGGGLVSYMSDATEPKEDYTELYAYPNPVHPTYQGHITIKGLMDDSEIRILDPGGNLVKTLQGTGGSVAWDGTNTQGYRVASGVYTALCNTKSGKGHGVVKILIIN